MPTRSANRTLLLSFSAFARIVGQVSSCQRRTACGFCSAARLSRRWKDSPHRFRYLPPPRLRSTAPGTASRSTHRSAAASTTARPGPRRRAGDRGLPDAQRRPARPPRVPGVPRLACHAVAWPVPLGRRPSHFVHHPSRAFSDTPNAAAASSRLRPAANAATARSRRAS